MKTRFLSVALLTILGSPLCAAVEELGGGFRHHGVAVPVSTHRGLVATSDGGGRDVVLAWLYDRRGGYALLLVDAATGRSEERPMPFPTGGDGPYASVLSLANRFYTHFGSHFCEFDPAKRDFTFHQKTTPQMAMSMTEDDQGVIWSVTYPASGLVSFDPRTRQLRDFGRLNKENWAQYPRSIAADDQGFIYFSLGSAAAQVVIFDPRTAQATPLWTAAERVKGYASLYRDEDGKVYAQSPGGAKAQWYELYQGQSRKIDPPPRKRPRPIIAGSQGLAHLAFPSGKQLNEFNLTERRFRVTDPQTKKTVEKSFDYSSEGAHAMGVIASPDGTICGGTAFPMRFFSYRPSTDAWAHHDCYGQWNTVARGSQRVYVGGYMSAGMATDRCWNTTRVSRGRPRSKARPTAIPCFSPTARRPSIGRMRCWRIPTARPSFWLARRATATPAAGSCSGTARRANARCSNTPTFYPSNPPMRWLLCRAENCWPERRRVRAQAVRKRPR